MLLSLQSRVTDGIQITYSGREDMIDFIKNDTENGCHFDFTYIGKGQRGGLVLLMSEGSLASTMQHARRVIEETT